MKTIAVAGQGFGLTSAPNMSLYLPPEWGRRDGLNVMTSNAESLLPITPHSSAADVTLARTISIFNMVKDMR